MIQDGKTGPGILPAPGEFRIIYEENGVLVMPEDPLTECTASSGNVWTLETREQDITVIDLAQQDQAISVNGEKRHLAPGDRLKFHCPAQIPAEKSVWFSEEYPEEPEMSMTDCSTPY